MTIPEEAKQLRHEILKLRPDKRRRYDDALRRRILSWVERAVAAGNSELDCSKAIGVKKWRFTLWRRLEARPPESERAQLALVHIEAPPSAMPNALVLVAPSGYRVEGLSLEQVATMLRGLA